MRYRARLLGRPELFVDGKPYLFSFKKSQILALMLTEERCIPKDKACEYLWPDKTPKKARRNLSNAVSRIKKIFPVSIAGGVVTLGDNVKIERDVDLLLRIDSLEWNEISELCRPFMDSADIDGWEAFSDWLLPKRQHYHNLLVKNLKKRAQAQLAGFAQNRFEDALLCYEKLAACEPYDEKIHGELVRLYIKTNQKIKAINAARAFSGRIENDFGIKADLSDISTLIKRRGDGPAIRASRRDTRDNPLSRSDEVMKMLGFFAGAGEGRSLCGMVWGEQGIGKTVFIGEITSILAERGWECFTLSCWQEEKPCPLASVTRLLKSLHISLSQKKNIKSLSDIGYSYIAEMIRERVAPSGGVKRLLVIEDMQWMDDASWNILETVMCDTGAPLNMLVSGFEEIRPTFMLRTALADEPFEKFELTLRRFNLEETGRICRETAPGEEWTDELIHEVYMQTEGNPFFIREFIKNKSEGVQGDGRQYRYFSTVELLGENERLFLEAIAVCPEYASMKHIARVLEISPLDVSKLCNNLRLHGFLREREAEEGDVFYYFTHTKLREMLLNGMLASRRTALHTKNVEILEAEAPARLRYRHRKLCARLFYHCREARMPLKELYWRVRELELTFTAVHEVFPTLVDQDLMHYIPTAEDSDYTKKAMNDAWEIMDRLFRSEGGSPELLALERDLYILKGGYLWWSRRCDDAAYMLRAALRKALAAGEAEPVIKAGVQMCYLAIQRDDGKRLAYRAKKLLRFAKKSGFREWEGTALRFLGISRVLLAKYDEADKYLLMSAAVFEKLEEKGINYTVCIIAADHFRGDSLFARKKIREALELYENCVKVGESVSLFRGLGLALAKAAFCHMLLGNYQEAEERLQRMGKVYNIMHTEWEDGLQGGGIAFSLMGVLHCRKKDWYHAGICFSVARRLAGETKRPLWQAVLCWAKLELYRNAGELPKEFAEGVLPHPRAWYEEQLALLKRKVGWM